MSFFKSRYRVDLSDLQAVCEANYWRLLRLMPAMADQDERRIAVDTGDGQSQALVMRVLERCRYTSTLQLLHERVHEWLVPPSMEVRLYHDAGMAEVVAAYNRRRFRGVYPYPNEQMLHPDEKYQLNLFLGEWLGHCQRHGQSAVPVELSR
ncbi:cytoplasmic protein [Pseudomonas sp. WN033]|nr:cytoplasmic protein [Pseudomonas sp. WN033]